MGIIFFPFLVWSIGVIPLGEQLTFGAIHSVKWLKVDAWLVFTAYYSLFLFAALVGYGLWNLGRWSRLALMIGAGLFACGSLVAMPFLRNTGGEAAIAGLVVAALLFAWIVWYLSRPGVAFVFGAQAAAEPPAGLSRASKISIGLLVGFTTAVVVAMALVFATQGLLRSSMVYREALVQAQESPCAAQLLGTPLVPGWFASGQVQRAAGTAHLEIPVTSTKGDGVLRVTASRRDGTWKIDSLLLVSDHGYEDLTVPGSACR